MLGTGENAEVVAEFLRQNRLKNVVLDPVLRSSSGADLIDYWGIEVIRTRLLPLSDVITPNLEEALVLAGESTGEEEATYSWEGAVPYIREAAQKLHKLGSKSLVITGGDLSEANDYLSFRESDAITEHILAAPRLESWATHGTGCAFATAIACRLAHGLQLIDAVGDAKEYVRQAMATSYTVGKGVGPMNHLFRLAELP
jgi:hydroxymethylpyrimidine kinase/phosphomethylpyrimidine kinase